MGEDTSEEETDYTTDSVACEDIELSWIFSRCRQGKVWVTHSIIEREPDLQAGEEIADGGRRESNQAGSWNANEASSGRDSDKTGNGTCAEANDGPAVEVSPVHDHPGDTCKASCQVGGSDGHGSSEIGSKGRATVEA